MKPARDATSGGFRVVKTIITLAASYNNRLVGVSQYVIWGKLLDRKLLEA